MNSNILANQITENSISANSSRQNFITNGTIFSHLAVWILNSDKCINNCTGNGICNFGRCICNNRYFGQVCDSLTCENSLCYTDLELFESQVCYHCSGNGKCKNGTCLCDNGYIGNDCSIKDCPNNCSNTNISTYGVCNKILPVSQCVCNKWKMRGGDDCSVIFCLNNCSINGVCNFTTGKCTCNGSYIGDDCSIFYVQLGQSKIHYLSLNYLFILLVIFIFLI